MNEFVSHVFKSLDSHESHIRKLIRCNRKNAIVLAFLAGTALYQSMKLSDLKFEMNRLSEKVRDLESEPNIQNVFNNS